MAKVPFSADEICKVLDVTSTNLGETLYRIRDRARAKEVRATPSAKEALARK